MLVSTLRFFEINNVSAIHLKLFQDSPQKRQSAGKMQAQQRPEPSFYFQIKDKIVALKITPSYI